MNINEAIKFGKSWLIDKRVLPYESKEREFIEMSIDALKESNDLFYKLVGVMHFVDKWLDDGEAEGLDEVQRADYVREKVLQIIERLEKENRELKQKCEKEYARGIKDSENNLINK